ncbi:MAG: hypothetical protein O3B01_07840 [Planctomycetota bacterium]|nr:hypothetical protein [Planctomycetota bacterium]MDA1138481.1 hypothetical protein [Planctomycetota bacterium]
MTSQIRVDQSNSTMVLSIIGYIDGKTVDAFIIRLKESIKGNR